MTTETVRLRLVFEDRHMLSKSKKKEGLHRSWFLLKPQANTISDLASHIIHTFRLHRTCPNGIILSMDDFVLPPFESRSILKDRDIVCVKRKGSISTAYEAPTLSSAPHGHQCVVELPKLLANEEFQEEIGGYKTLSEEDNVDQFEDILNGESKSPRDVVSKKRKASKKLKDSRQKKIKLSSAEELAVIPEEPVEKNESSQGFGNHRQLSPAKKRNRKSSKPDYSNTLDNEKQTHEVSESTPKRKRFCQLLEDSKCKDDLSNSPNGTKKLPSRSARRKKAKRQWLREQSKLEKEKLLQGPEPAKDGQQLPVKDNNCIVSDVHQEPDEESDADNDFVPVEIRPGHIRFEPLSKDQAVPQNQLREETFRWNGITNKKKGQKWGIEKSTFVKGDDNKWSYQECSGSQNAEEKQALLPVDFDKLISYTSLPKVGDVIAYRLIELSSSWTPEISSFRVGKISWYNPESNKVRVEPIVEYPFDFEKNIDEEVSTLQSDPTPYADNGSLEIDYASLVDVRIVKPGNSELANVVASSDALVDPTNATKRRTDELVDGQTAVRISKPQKEDDGHSTSKVNGEANAWDEINEALTAKKAKLSLENGWKKENSGTRSWSHRALRCSALGPTMAFLRSQNGLKETSP